MKAITRRKYGPPEVLALEEIEQPLPKANEILVRVHATTINRTDCGVVTGQPFIFRFFVGGLSKPHHIVPGTDFAGEVAAVGTEVKNFKVGDKVWGFDDEGLQSQAQFMTIKESEAVLKMPEGYTYEEVAACIEGPHYAYNFLNKVALKKNSKVLLNYETEDFTKDTERYDAVCDAVGKSRFPYCKPLLKDGGIYVSSELGKGLENLYLPLMTLFSKKQVKFPIPNNPKRSLIEMNELLAQRKYKPVIDRTYRMSQAKEAYTYVMSGQKTGNVILKIDEA